MLENVCFLKMSGVSLNESSTLEGSINRQDSYSGGPTEIGQDSVCVRNDSLTVSIETFSLQSV